MDDHFASDLVSDRQIETPEDYPYRPQPAVMGVRDYPEERESSRLWLKLANYTGVHVAVICLGVFFAFANLAVCPTLAMFGHRGAAWPLVPSFILCGAVLAEGALLSAGLVFLASPFWLRGVLCWGIGLILWICWAIGLFIAEWLGPWPDTYEVLQVGSLSLPLVALAIQSPLWFARCYLGWRLTTGRITAAACPLSIRDYFVGTAIVAGSITLARLGRPAVWPVEDYWPGWSILFASFVGGSLLGIVPAMLLMLRFRNAWLGFGLLVLYSVIVSALVVVFERSPPGFNFFLATISISAPVFLAIGLRLARACGYTLKIGRES